MKKNVLFLTACFIGLAMFSFAQTKPMDDEPDGGCLTCKPCEGEYIICESWETAAFFDKLDNCGPGSTSTFLILEGC